MRSSLQILLRLFLAFAGVGLVFLLVMSQSWKLALPLFERQECAISIAAKALETLGHAIVAADPFPSKLWTVHPHQSVESPTSSEPTLDTEANRKANTNIASSSTTPTGKRDRHSLPAVSSFSILDNRSDYVSHAHAATALANLEKKLSKFSVDVHLLAQSCSGKPVVLINALTFPQSQDIPFVFSIPREALKKNQQSAYLTIVRDLLQRKDEAMADTSLKSTYLDVTPWYLVAVGEHAKADEMESLFRQTIGLKAETRTEEPPFGNVKARSAVDVVVEQSRRRRIVMMNEEHRSSVQRAFLNLVLDGLIEEGFTHLALEAVNSNAFEGINQRGYPVLSSGAYTLDPVLGDAIRRARAAGLTIVSYDYDHPDVPEPDDIQNPVVRENHREESAARHLQDLIDKNPSARLIVYAGRGHIAEQAADGWLPMSARLKEKTGIDPLTVNLTHMVSYENRAYQHNAYHHASAQGLIGCEPVALLQANGEPWSHMPGVFDLAVFHPRPETQYGRPRFLQMGGLRKPVSLELENSQWKQPMLVQAHSKSESADAVPVDQFIAWPQQPLPSLLLRKGHYSIQVINSEGQRQHQQDLQVE